MSLKEFTFGYLFWFRDETFPEMKHTTGNRLTSYCNCGRRQGTRDEPFTIREANYSFYQRVGRDCCEKLERWVVPIFTPSEETETGEGLTVQEMLLIIQNKCKQLLVTTETNPILEGEDDLENASQAMERECRQKNNEDFEEEVDDEDKDDLSQIEDTEKEKEESVGTHEGQSQSLADKEDETDNENTMESLLMSQEDVPDKLPSVVWNSNHIPIMTEAEEKEPEVETIPSEVPEAAYPATMQYLPGMIHSKSPSGLLPLFPSWSLVRLGPSK